MKRIPGLDVARALAVIGMIIVNFKVVFGSLGSGWALTFASFFEGKAAATFVVLAGVGLALTFRKALKFNNREMFAIARKKVLIRAAFLFLAGISYIVIWPADILHFYGVYMLFIVLFAKASQKTLLWLTALFVFAFPLLMIFFDYEAGWDFNTLEYAGLWSPIGFFRNLFFNGFHPVIPWTAFMLYGYWLGKQDLKSPTFIRIAFARSLLVFMVIQLITIYLEPQFTDEMLKLFFSVHPMPPLPLYMINGMAIATLIITGSIAAENFFTQNLVMDALIKTGQLALTFYVAHVVIGMGAAEMFLKNPFGEYSASFSVTYALLFSFACVVFAVQWKRRFHLGPVEWLMKLVTQRI